MPQSTPTSDASLARPATELPEALEAIDALVARLRQGRPMIFLDYDGTLSPIVERPQDAVMSEAMREAVVALARVCPVAVLSGRDLEDVRGRVGVEGIAYGGSHGFDLMGPDGESLDPGGAARFLPALDRAERELEARLSQTEGMEGARLERKRFSLAVHYRQVPEGRVDALRETVEVVRAQVGELRCSHGKKVLDLQPDIDWHKGRALAWMLDGLEEDEGQSGIVALYVGDDTTDEDAFRALREPRERGVGVAVRDDDRPTAARYRVRDTDEVLALLRALEARLGEGGDAG